MLSKKIKSNKVCMKKKQLRHSYIILHVLSGGRLEACAAVCARRFHMCLFVTCKISCLISAKALFLVPHVTKRKKYKMLPFLCSSG